MSDIKAVVKSTLDSAAKSIGEDAGPAVEDMQTGAKKIIDGCLDDYGNVEDDVTGNIQGVNPAADEPHLSPGEEAPPTTGTPPEGGSPGSVTDPDAEHLEGDPVPEAGQEAGGNGSTENGGTDPVDVVSGQLLSTVVDLVLPGVLPLVLRRAYASGYRSGALFGPGWSSTLDIRLVVDTEEGGIRFLGDDAQTLEYAQPPSLGLPVFPANGARWPLAHDRERQEFVVDDPGSGRSWRFADAADAADTPDAQGGAEQIRPLRCIVDRNGNRISFLRDETGAVTEVAHCGGYRVAVDHQDIAAGRRISGLRLLDGSNDGAGTPLLSFGYDDAGRLAAVTDSSGVPYQYTSDEADRIVGWTDRNGHWFTYEYDDDGRVIRTEGEGGYLNAELVYDLERRVTTVTDSLGSPTEYRYDRYQHITEVVDPLGGLVRTRSDRYGRLLERTDQLGNITRIERDHDGDAVRIVRSDGAETRAHYDGLDKPVRITAASGATWQYMYDQAGNLTSFTDPLGAVTAYTRDAHGAVTAVTDALGDTTSFVPDAAGLAVEATDPLGATARVRRDAFGRVVESADALDSVFRTRWSVEGRPLWRQGPDGTTESWTYDPAGNMTAYRDQLGSATEFAYGPMNQRVERRDPTGNRYSFEHDTELRLASVSGPTGRTWSYTYDAAGRMVAERDFNDRVLSYAHDVAGRLLRRTNGAGEHVDYLRDAFGQAIERRTGEDVVRFTYDVLGEIVRAEDADGFLDITRDALGRPVSETSAAGTLTREYDLLGQMVRRTTPSGAISTWSYDAAGLPSELATAAGAIGFQHDAAGRESSRTLGPDGSVTRTLDPLGRLTAQSVVVVGETVQQHRYAYRADGLPIEISDVPGSTRSLSLDPAGRVANVSAETWTESYSYDELGNLVSAVYPPGGDAEADSSTDLDATGTLIRRAGRTNFDYDAQCRLVRRTRRTLSGQTKEWTYRWDAQDRLVELTTPDRGTWRYTYDPLGRRIAKARVNGDGSTDLVTSFTWDGPCVAEETGADAAGRSRTLTWDYEPGTARPVAQTRRLGDRAAQAAQSEIDAEFHAIVTDPIGGVRELVAADGRVTPRPDRSLWGRFLPGRADTPQDAVECPLGFPGQYTDDETGLFYNVHRYYDPEIAGYLTADPLGLVPAPNDHAYVDNPLAFCDPVGLEPQDGAPTEGMGPNGEARWTADLSHVTGKTAQARNKALDAIVKEDFPDLNFTHDPQYSPFVGFGVSKSGEGTQIGPKAFQSRAQLRNTLVHEELHHRWFSRGLTDHHPRDGSGTSDRFYQTVQRYERMRGWSS